MNDDWRLQGQDRYLKGVTFTFRSWRRRRLGWDHDHCEFCTAKFAAFDAPDVLHSGWTTPDERRWVCDTCFADFRERFGWRVETSPGNEPSGA